MTAAGAYVPSPGWQLVVWLGPAQLRLWRRLDRLLGASSSRSSTVRGIARDVGENAGMISRDLDRLGELGLVAHTATRGRLGGVVVYRTVRRWASRIRSRARVLRRLGAPAPGQLILALAAGDGDGADPPGRPWWDTEPDEPELEEPAPVATFGDRPATLEELEREAGPGSTYATIRCTCGRLRLTRGGDTTGPCTHGRP